MASRDRLCLACTRAARAVVPAACALVVLLSAAPAAAQDDDPFRRPGPPAAGGPPPPASPLDTLELRGVFTSGGVTYITLFNTADSKSTIVPLDSTVNGLSVSDYQQADDSVLVRSGGREKRVNVKKVQIVAMAVPPPAPPPQPGATPAVAGVPVPPGQPGAAMGDEEVRARMQRVADEIRRRREMRREIMERQAQQQQPQPGQPPTQ